MVDMISGATGTTNVLASLRKPDISFKIVSKKRKKNSKKSKRK